MIFPDIETYIEFIAGYRDITGTQVRWYPEITLKLASYDVGFVQSVAEQTINNHLPMSVKQAALAESLIKKYERQLTGCSVHQPNHKTYRYPLRDVVHVSSLTRKDDMLHLRFPFDATMIDDIKKHSQTAQGKVYWSKPDKAWILSLTEYNVSWSVAYATSHRIPVAPEVKELFDLIIDVEQTPYKIELNLDENKKFYITNAPDSMQEYLTENVGFDNIYALVDSAGVMGYTVNKEIWDIMEAEHGSAFMKLCVDRNIDLVPNKEETHTISEIIEWAVKVDRLPICFYNPNFLHDGLAEFRKYFKDEEIAKVNMNDLNENTAYLDPKIKIVYTNKILENWDGRMPVLITTANLMHGETKKKFLSHAEKVVYYCSTLPRK